MHTTYARNLELKQAALMIANAIDIINKGYVSNSSSSSGSIISGSDENNSVTAILIGNSNLLNNMAACRI